MSSESFYPHAFLLQPSSSISILVSGPYIQLIETSTGNVLKNTTQDKPTVPQDDTQVEAKKKKEKGAAQLPSPFIRCVALGGPNGTAKYLATAGDDKVLRVYEVDDLRLLNERELPKRPTDICFTKDGETIVVGDKFGDVFSYSLQYEPAPAPSEPIEKTRESVMSHENPSNGTLILGHTSLLTAFALSRDEKYIITADRDEHIRVSWFPQGYVIETFCLGHQKYVTAIHNPTFSPAHLISGGGDSFFCFWDWQAGKLLHRVNGIRDAVEPYIKIESRKRKNWDGRDDEGEGELKGRRARRKNKQRGKKNPNTKTGGEEDGQETEEEEKAVEEGATQDLPGSGQAEPEKKALVINKIATVSTEGGQNYVVFSAVGTTALFALRYPDLESSEPSSTPAIDVLDLGFPVIDFSVAEEGLIYAALDGNWSADGTNPPVKRWAAAVNVSSTGQLEEVSPDSNPLLKALNSSCLIGTTPEQLDKLDLYSDITSLPKWSGPDGSAAEPLELPEAATPLDTPTPSFASPSEIWMVGEKSSSTSLSKRLLGRQRKKDAVHERLQQHSSSATPRAETPVDEPHHKRAKTEEDEQNGADVVMADS